MHLTVQQLLDLVRDPLSGFGVLRVELGFSGLPEILQHVNDIQDHDHTHAIGVGSLFDIIDLYRISVD